MNTQTMQDIFVKSFNEGLYSADVRTYMLAPLRHHDRDALVELLRVAADEPCGIATAFEHIYGGNVSYERAKQPLIVRLAEWLLDAEMGPRLLGIRGRGREPFRRALLEAAQRVEEGSYP